MRIFGGEQIANMMTRFNIPEDQPLSHGIVSRAIEQAQVKVEGFNFDARKHLVEYDDVLNKHREIIYGMRREVLESEKMEGEGNLKEQILGKIEREISNIVSMYQAEGFSEKERENIIQNFATIIPFDDSSRRNLVQKTADFKEANEMIDFLVKLAKDTYAKREKEVTPQIMRQVERFVFLSVIDQLWMDHLTAIEDLREGIGLRGYGQRDPLIEYKNEAFVMFERLVVSVDSNITGRIFRVQIQLAPGQIPETPIQRMPQKAVKPEAPKPQEPVSQIAETPIEQAARQGKVMAGGVPIKTGAAHTETPAPTPIHHQKIGRNDPCPCGSGKKYKKCHYPQYG